MRSLLLLVCVASAGCTYYTDCPGGGVRESGEACETEEGVGGGAGTGGNSGSGGSGGLAGAVPTGEWVDATGDLVGTEAGCTPVIFAKPDEDLMIAGIASGGLHGSRDGGETWSKLGQAEGSAEIVNVVTSMVFDPEHPSVFWEAGMYFGGGAYRTDDGGETFQQLGSVTHIDSVAVDFSDPDRRTLLSFTHEGHHQLNRSTDGGEAWSAAGETIPGEANGCNYPLILDTDTYLIACSQWGGGEGGIYRTEDAGESWSRVSEFAAQYDALLTNEGDIYWAGETFGGLVRSADNGQMFENVVGNDIVVSARPSELPDGRIIALGQDHVIISSDGGRTWRPASSELPFDAAGVAYSAYQRAFFVWQLLRCEGQPVSAETLMRYSFDYESD